MNKIIKSSLLLLLLSTSITKTSDFEDNAKIFGGIVLAGAAVVGIIKFVDWATTESNQSLNSRAVQRLQSARAKFNEAIRANNTNQAEELKLHSIYSVARQYETSALKYVKSLNGTIDSLNRLSSTLQKRINKLSSNLKTYENINAHQTLSAIFNDINPYLERLSDLAQIVNRNKSYLSLSDSYTKYAYKYEKERLNNYTVIQQALIKFRNYPYPLIQYQNEIAADLNDFKQEIDSVNSQYLSLVDASNKLHKEIYTVYAIISSSPELNNELARRDNDAREQEKINIEKRKAAAQERQARALEEQARAQREEAEAKKREAAVRERELRERQYYGSQPSHIYL